MNNKMKIFRNNKKLTILLRTLKHINDENYVDKVFNIDTLNIHLGSLRKTGDIFYNIEIKNNNSGFFAHIYWVMNGLYIADRLGLIPYVSIIGSKYNKPNDLNDNAYEHYYVQKNAIDDNASFINYEISLASYIWKEFDMDGYIVSEAYIDAMAEILKKYMPLREEIQKQIKEEIESLIPNPVETLAVHSRGTAYSVGFYGHPIQVTFEDYKKSIDEALSKGFTKIFLATDDETIKQQFQREYGSRVIFFGDVLRSSNSLDVIDLKSERNDNSFLMGYEVLRDAMAMAYCDGFIAGFSKVSMYTRIVRRTRECDFRYIDIIDKGIVNKKRFFSELLYKVKRVFYSNDIHEKKN